jgi:hypothetical protein
MKGIAWRSAHVCQTVVLETTPRQDARSMTRATTRSFSGVLLSALLTACCCPMCDAPDPIEDAVARTDRVILQGTAIIGVPRAHDDGERDEYPLGRRGLPLTFVYSHQSVEVELYIRDLSATAGPDLASAAQRELALQGPQTLSSVRPLRARDPSTRLVALDLVVPPNAYPAYFAAYAYAQPTGLVVWVEARCRENPCDLTRAHAETDATMRTLRPGAAALSTSAGELKSGDLFDEIDVPAGYTMDVYRGGNEEPPYVTPYTITITTVRALGTRAPHELVVRSGVCASRSGPGVAGTMFGQAMTWRFEGEQLCWDEPDAADAYGGIAWVIRGDVERHADLIGIAATARR